MRGHALIPHGHTVTIFPAAEATRLDSVERQ